MPYAPAVQYRGDQYAYQGISNLGNIFSEELKKYMELKKQGDTNDTIVQHAVSTGMLKPEEYNNYVQANWTKKQGIANGIIANMHDDWQKQMFQQQEQDKQAALDNAVRIAGMHIGSAESINQANIDAGKFAAKGGEPVETDPLIDPTTKQPVPGYGIVRKTGQVVPTTADVPDVILDPTKRFQYTGPKTGWKPLNPKLARQITADTPGAGDMPAAQPNMWQRNAPTWLGGTPAPTPTPSPTLPPPDIPAAQGVTGPGSAGPTVQTVDPATARSQAKAKIDAGGDRDAVIARLKQLRVDTSGL